MNIISSVFAAEKSIEISISLLNDPLDNRLVCENPDDFPCADSILQNGKPICVPYSVTCDGIWHCVDGSDEDEKYCAIRKCRNDYFHCFNNRCVKKGAKCDGNNDCGDFSDEAMCGDCGDGKFRCGILRMSCKASRKRSCKAL